MLPLTYLKVYTACQHRKRGGVGRRCLCSASKVSWSCPFPRWLNYLEQHSVLLCASRKTQPNKRAGYNNIHYAKSRLTGLEQNQATTCMTDVQEANTSCRHLGWQLTTINVVVTTNCASVQSVWTTPSLLSVVKVKLSVETWQWQKGMRDW